MYLQIDSSSGTPVYLQIIEQIKKGISLGVFPIGKPLPTIRDIALELRVNPNTVAKAIRELEREGILKTYVGKGSYVSESAIDISKNEGKVKLAFCVSLAISSFESFIKDVKWLGFSKEEVLNIFQENWDRLESEVKTDGKNDN